MILWIEIALEGNSNIRKRIKRNKPAIYLIHLKLAKKELCNDKWKLFSKILKSILLFLLELRLAIVAWTQTDIPVFVHS